MKRKMKLKTENKEKIKKKEDRTSPIFAAEQTTDAICSGDIHIG